VLFLPFSLGSGQECWQDFRTELVIWFKLGADKVEGPLVFACFPRPIQLLVAVELQLSNLSPPLVLCAVPAIQLEQWAKLARFRAEVVNRFELGPTKLKVLYSLLVIRVPFDFCWGQQS
jgi:hypothetical protein